MSLRDIAKARELSAVLEGRIPPVDTEELAGKYTESKHDRGKGGKFAPKGTTAPPPVGKTVAKAAASQAPAPSAPGAFIIPDGTNTDNTAGENVPVGLTKAGNINLHERPVVKNKDGSVSTVRSISIGTDEGEVLIPTVVGNKVVSDEEAIKHYKETGEHLGIFDTPENADAYSQTLHKEQENEYSQDSPQIKANKDIQSKLNDLGAKLDIDGRIGPKTKDAIRAAQIKLNKEGASPPLKVDGIWGDKTEAAFKKVSKVSTVASPKKEPAKPAPAKPAPKASPSKPASPTKKAEPVKEAPKPHGPNKKIVN